MTSLAPADSYASPTRTAVDATPLAVIRHEGVTLGKMEDFFDADYTVLNQAADAGRFEQVGPPLALFHGDPRGTFDMEVGLPIASALDGDAVDGDSPVVGSELPAGTAVALTHIGSYGGLGACWNTLARTADAEPTGDWAEVYVTEPGLTPAEQLRTDCLLYIRA